MFNPAPFFKTNTDGHLVAELPTGVVVDFGIPNIVHPLALITGLAVGAVTSNSVALIWAALPYAVSYVVQDQPSGGAFVTYNSSVSGTSLTVTGLLPSSTVNFRVAAVDLFGRVGAWSSVVSATTAGVGVALPGAPTAVTAGTPTAASLPIAWTAPATGGAPGGYNITFTPSGGAAQTLVLSGTATSATLVGLSAATAYTITVAATNAAGTGPASAAATATTAAASGAAGGAFGPVAASDGLADGIYLPDVIHYHNTFTGSTYSEGVARISSGKPVTTTLSGAAAAQFYPVGGASFTFMTGGNNPTADLAGTVTATDGTTTYIKAVTFKYVASGPVVVPGSAAIFDTGLQNFAYEQPPAGASTANARAGFRQWNLSEANGATLTDPAGLIWLNADTFNQYIATTDAATPISAHAGRSDVTINLPGGGTQAETVWRMVEQPAAIAFTLAAGGALYDYHDAGDIIGAITGSSETGAPTYVLTASNGTIFLAAGGTLRVRGALIVGTTTFTVEATHPSGKKTSKTFNLPVLAGNRLPATNMTLSIPTTLDNYVFQQVLGTPVVTGITGTPRWTASTPLDIAASIWDGQPRSPVVCDPATGRTAAWQQLSARVGADKHSLTLTVTDGPNFCRQTFLYNVAWAAGPDIYIGPGMAAAHPGFGYDHFADFEPQLTANNNPDHGSALGCPTLHWNYVSDPDYYANDNGGGAAGDPGGVRRFGLRGPFRMVAVRSSASDPLVRVGGVENTVGQGTADNNKAFFIVGSGDAYFEGFDVSGCIGYDSSHGVSGIRADGDSWGELTVVNCHLHDNNNDLELGDGPRRHTVNYNILDSFGTEYVGNGATHASYDSPSVEFIAIGNLIYHGTNGHGEKVRALRGNISYNRIYDDNAGSLSSCLDLPEGGQFTVSNNVFMKGPNAQNPFAMQVGEEGVTDGMGNQHRITIVNSSNNTFILMCPDGNHFGEAKAIGISGATSLIDGSNTIVTSTNDSVFLGSPNSGFESTPNAGFNQPFTFTSTGLTTLTAPPLLDYTPPAGMPAVPRFGPFIAVSDGSQTFDNFNGVQIDVGVDNLRADNTKPAGTVIAPRMVPSGAILQGTQGAFGPGTTWALVQDPQWGGQAPWAPASRFTVTTNADGTGQLAMGTGPYPIPGTVDYVKVRATGPTGVKCDYRLAIPWIGNAPAAPMAVTNLASTPAPGGVTLSWTNAAGATAWSVTQRVTGAGGAFGPCTLSSAATATGATVTLAAGTYDLQVVASNVGGPGPAAVLSGVVVAAPAPAPTANLTFAGPAGAPTGNQVLTQVGTTTLVPADAQHFVLDGAGNAQLPRAQDAASYGAFYALGTSFGVGTTTLAVSSASPQTQLGAIAGGITLRARLTPFSMVGVIFKNNEVKVAKWGADGSYADSGLIALNGALSTSTIVTSVSVHDDGAGHYTLAMNGTAMATVNEPGGGAVLPAGGIGVCTAEGDAANILISAITFGA